MHSAWRAYNYANRSAQLQQSNDSPHILVSFRFISFHLAWQKRNGWNFPSWFRLRTGVVGRWRQPPSCGWLLSVVVVTSSANYDFIWNAIEIRNGQLVQLHAFFEDCFFFCLDGKMAVFSSSNNCTVFTFTCDIDEHWWYLSIYSFFSRTNETHRPNPHVHGGSWIAFQLGGKCFLDSAPELLINFITALGIELCK